MNSSHWIDTTPDAGCPTLVGKHTADVAIVGGGLTGLHTALKLLEEDSSRKVVVIEADRIAADASGRTVGKLATSHFGVLEHLPPEDAGAYTQANVEGFDRVLELIKEYEIDCDLERASNYGFASTEKGVARIRKEFDAMVSAGLNVEWLDSRRDEVAELPLEFAAGVRHTHQAVYHPRKFALGLLRAIRSRGGVVYEHSPVADLKEQDDGVILNLAAGSVKADKAVVATRIGLNVDEPFMDNLSPWRGHLGAFLLPERPIKNAYLRHKGPVLSLRPNEEYLVLNGFSADAQPFEDEKNYEAVGAWVKETFPHSQFATADESSFWWGEDADSADRMPLLGTYRPGLKHTFMAAGFSGWGMTKTAFAGIMLADLISGRPSPYQETFNPWRFS